MIIRQVNTPKDALDFEELAIQHHDEFGGSREFDRDALAKHIFYAVSDPDRKYINGWVAYDEHDTPIGYIAGTMRDSLYSKRYYAIQEMWYVVPRARGTWTSISLLKQFERWAIERNAERIYTQVEHDADEELTEYILRLLTKVGYRKHGYTCVKTFNSEKEVDDDRTTHRSVGAEQAQH